MTGIPMALATLIVAGTVSISPAVGRCPQGAPLDVISYTVQPSDAPPSVAVLRGVGGAPRRLDLPVDGAAVARLSTDGRRLVTATFLGDTLRPAVVGLDESGFTRLTVPGVATDANVSPCSWAGRQRLLCSVRTSTGTIDGIYLVSATDRFKARRLTVNPYPPTTDFGGGDVIGDVSPDGQRFVFMRAKPAPPPTHPERTQSGALFVGSVDGHHIRQMTAYGIANSHDSGFESWSPRGDRILFATEEGQLRTTSPDGTGTRSITLRGAEGSFAYAPVWSPDGSRIAFGMHRSSDGQADIYYASAHGGRLHQITDTTDVDDAPDWGAAKPSARLPPSSACGAGPSG